MTSITYPFSPARLYCTLRLGRLRLASLRLGTLPREAMIGGALALISAAAIAGINQTSGKLGSGPALDSVTRPTVAPPAVQPLLVRNLAPATAADVNREIPFASGPNLPARPFKLGRIDAEPRSRALDCLSQAIYYEAGSESADGQRAVAQVVLNRVRHPAYPSSVCAVVYQGSERVTGCQFTYTCDGALASRPSIAGMARARKIADAALRGKIYAPVGTATHYHTDYVVPYWAASLDKSAVVGTHIFYRWSGGWGRPAAFGQRYSGREAEPAALRAAALSAELAEASAVVEGPLAALVTTEPGSKGERVAIRLSAARAAVEAAPHRDYVDSVAASTTLRWSLADLPSSATSEPPLGRSVTPASEPAAAPAAKP